MKLEILSNKRPNNLGTNSLLIEEKEYVDYA